MMRLAQRLIRPGESPSDQPVRKRLGAYKKRPSLREARLKVSSTFSKVVESRGKASGRSPQRAEPPCAHKSAGGGLRGNPRQGFPLIYSLRFFVCAFPFAAGRYTLLPFDPISFALAKRNGVEPSKKSACPKSF